MHLSREGEPKLLPSDKPKVKKIFQDEWFEEWFTRRDDGFLACRFIEYAWILRHIDLDKGSILDSGCGASCLPLLLALHGFDVVGTDLNNYDYKFGFYEFVQGDSTVVDLGRRRFDRITMISSLEHYGIQQIEEEDADFKAVNNLGKYLKHDGLWLVTVPYGKEMLMRNWRIYNQKRLERLFPRIIKQEYFIRDGQFWVKTTREEVENIEHKLRMGANTVTCLVAGK